MTLFQYKLSRRSHNGFMGSRKVKGGEIFVPKIPSYRIIDVAEAIDPNCEKKVIGIRPGEKIHEEMITQSDSQSTVDLGKYFGNLANNQALRDTKLLQKYNAKKCRKNFHIIVGNNTEFLSINELKLINEYFSVNNKSVRVNDTIRKTGYKFKRYCCRY